MNQIFRKISKILSLGAVLQACGNTSALGQNSDGTIQINSNNAINYGLDYEKAERILKTAGIPVFDGTIEVQIHEETSAIDLSSLDGFSVRVDVSAVRDGQTNGTTGGV